MPAPDYPRVPFPDHIPHEDRWWFEPPIPGRVFEGIEQIDRRIAAFCAEMDKRPAWKVAQMIDEGYLHEGWPWELTERGKSLYRGSRRASRS